MLNLYVDGWPSKLSYDIWGTSVKSNSLKAADLSLIKIHELKLNDV